MRWVTLIAPDIDPDVFRAQTSAIGALQREFYILLARQDRGLSLSSVLTGGRDRIGRNLTRNQVRDLSGLADGQGLDHGVGFRSPAAIRALIALSDGTAPPQDRRPEILSVLQIDY